MVITPASAFVNALPAAPAGLGVFEAGAVAAYSLVGVGKADALAMAEGEMAEARTCLGLALIAARMGEAATVRAYLASVDAALAASKAWRELADYEVTP